jgi:cytochrome P450
VAGHETTASVLNWTWYLLSQHPRVERNLADELGDLAGRELPPVDEFPKYDYTCRVLEEVMRLYPPGWLMTRRALNDDWLGEYFVPAGTEIYVSPYFIHRRPEYWDAPAAFDPDRFAGEARACRHELALLPFSAGPRNCIGEQLARMEMQVHVMTIAPRIRLRYTPPGPPALNANVNLLSKHEFVMTPELRTDAAG